MRLHHVQVLPSPEALEEVAGRLTHLGYSVDRREWATFPGHLRVHAADAHGNRVELLA
jgi:hypothetical protein